MVVGITKEPVPGGVDPFTGTVDQTDYLTHGRLPENIDSGVRKKNPGLRNPIRLRTGPYKDRIVINNFLYSQGDLSYPGKRGLPPAVRQGHSLEFVNEDKPLTERFHTITACKAPCNLTGGIGYPLANGAGFDSGELGYGPTISTALYGGGGASTVPITAVVDTPADKANCKTVPGLVEVIANGCVGHRRLQDAEEPEARHVHVLLPDPPVHARCVPGREEEVVAADQRGGRMVAGQLWRPASIRAKSHQTAYGWNVSRLLITLSQP